MELPDMLYICQQITNISAIPIRVYDQEKPCAQFGLDAMPVDPVRPWETLLCEKPEEISYYCTPYHQYFGLVRHRNFLLVIGPIGSIGYTLQEKRNYAFSLGISLMDFDTLLAAMRQIPAFTPETFLHLLLLLHFYFNGEKMNISEIKAYMQLENHHTALPQTARPHTARPHTADLHTARPHAMDTAYGIPGNNTPQSDNILLDSELPPHSTRSYEKELMNYVREGDISGLEAFLFSSIHGGVGLLSPSLLRQQKNLFIVAATLISRAAMEGGLYEDEAYALSDAYIRRCEALFSPDAVMRLNFEMAMDFTRRVFSLSTKTALSPFVAAIVTHIRRNISGDLSCKHIASLFSINRNQLNNRFKAETGKTLSAFVMNEKIRRAKNLLAGTEKSISEIATYLGFSSQSHFQSVFKEHANQTPKAFRISFTGE